MAIKKWQIFATYNDEPLAQAAESGTSLRSLKNAMTRWDSDRELKYMVAVTQSDRTVWTGDRNRAWNRWFD